jgi:hypothetical protein
MSVTLRTRVRDGREYSELYPTLKDGRAALANALEKHQKKGHQVTQQTNTVFVVNGSDGVFLQEFEIIEPV